MGRAKTREFRKETVSSAQMANPPSHFFHFLVANSSYTNPYSHPLDSPLLISAELFTTRRMSSRRRPLHTCGVSFLAIARGICSRAQNLDGWLGSTARKMVRATQLVNPLIYVLQYQWLLFLSFIDDRLLAIANIVEKIFPPSTLVFVKIDDLLHMVETFPGKFADAVDELPCFNQVLFLEWAVTHAISLLKFMLTILMNWGRDGTREKEIPVDVNYNKGRNGSKSADKSECCSEGTISSASETQQAAMDKNMKSDAMGTKGKEVDCRENENGTHKIAMEEEGTRDEAMEDKEEFENDEKGSTKKVEHGESCKKDDGDNKRQKPKIPDNKSHKGNSKAAGLRKYEHEEEASSGRIQNEEDILELFETSWLMKPTGKGKGSSMPRSASVF